MLKQTLLISTLIICILPLSTQAKNSAAEGQAYIVLSKDPTILTDDDFREVLYLAIDNKITIAQIDTFIERLTTQQDTYLNDFIKQELAQYQQPDTPDKLVQAQQNEDQLLAEHTIEPFIQPRAINGCDPNAQMHGFCWQQFIEYFTPYIPQTVQSTSWHQEYLTICDNDPSDTDLVLFFDISSINPDKLRWATTDGGIYIITRANPFNGFDFDNWGVHLCIENKIGFYSNASLASKIKIYLED